jgi:hypothetical protein
MEEKEKLKASLERISKKIGQLHDYTRSTMQLLIAWFTFFVAVNSATAGWLVTKPKDAVSFSGPLIWIIAGVFTLQNVLGIIACKFIRAQLLTNKTRIEKLEADLLSIERGGEIQDTSVNADIPDDLYSKVTWLMTASLLALALLWATFLVIIHGTAS